MNGLVEATAVFDDGGGPELYVGGEFTTAGGLAAARFFSAGTTTVTCTATDASGNESTCGFPITVQPKAKRR